MAYAWGQERLGDMGETFTGLSGKSKEDFGHGNAKFVTYMNVYLNPIADLNMLESVEVDNKQSKVQYGDMFFTTSSETPEEVGMSSIWLGNVENLYLNSFCFGYRLHQKMDPYFMGYLMRSPAVRDKFIFLAQGISRYNISKNHVMDMEVSFPGVTEQEKIGKLLYSVDSLLSLHQRSPPTANNNPEEATRMIANDKTFTPDSLFCDYFESWIKVYKEGAITRVTMQKYQLSLSWVKKIAPDLKLKEINRLQYQEILNEYAKYHERQTTMDFHHHIKAAILDAIDERLIDKDPTRKAIIKGKTPREKKLKYLSQFELHSLLGVLKLSDKPNWDWLILLIAKTGIRFSEALAVTPKDFDFSRQMLSISKTWNYKEDKGGFLPTKNKSSVRKIPIDWHTVIQFAVLVKDLPEDKPIFAGSRVFNATANDCLARRCKKAGIPVITMHGLRHTHASLLLFAGVSIASVAKRLGHSSMNTTERTYLHIIQELENKDIDLVMRALAGLV